MTNQEWLSKWANNVKYSDSEDLFRKIFNEVVCAEKPFECEVRYSPIEDTNSIKIELVEESTTSSVVLEKR